MTEDQVRKAQAIKVELPHTVEAFGLLEAHLMRSWINCQSQEERESLWFRIRGLRDVKQMLINDSAPADIAEHTDALHEQGFQP